MKFTHLGKATGLGIRILAGLAFGVLAGSLVWHRGMGIVFLIALFGGTASISLGLGLHDCWWRWQSGWVNSADPRIVICINFPVVFPKEMRHTTCG